MIRKTDEMNSSACPQIWLNTTVMWRRGPPRREFGFIDAYYLAWSESLMEWLATYLPAASQSQRPWPM